MLKKDFTLIKELLGCHAIHAQAIDSGLPGFQRSPANGCLLGNRSQIVTMTAQHAFCNVQHKALCSKHASQPVGRCR